MTRWLVVAVVLAGCGDNEPCVADYVGYGPLADPYAFDLPDDCVALPALLGRWFVADATQHFSYGYPKFEGSCHAGFHQLGVTDDHDASDGATTYTWWDGTRFFVHEYSQLAQYQYEYAHSFVACARRDGRIAAISATYSKLEGTILSDSKSEMTGEPFAARDSLASGLELVGELGTRPDGDRIGGLNLVVDDGYAFVAGFSGLDIIDVTDPATPQHVASVSDARGFNDVKVVHSAGRRIAYAAPFDGMNTVIIDVTDATRPIVKGSLPYSHSLFVTGTALYLADYTNAVPEYDVSNPLVPQLLGRAPITGAAGTHDLYVDGATLFVNDTTNGFVALDISAGIAHAVELARTPAPYSHSSWVGTAGGRKVVLHGDEGMTLTPDGAAFVRVLDGDPTSPTFLQDLGRYQSRPQVGSHNFVMVGDRAYIAYYQDGVRVVDLSDPTQPREVAHYNTWDDATAAGGAFEGALGIRVADGLIYVADSERGLLILREL